MANTILTIQQIQNQIIANIQANPTLAVLNNPSTTAIWNLIAFIVATAVWVGNQVNLIFQTQTEAAIALAPAWTDEWIQAQAFLFQWSSSVPQVLQLSQTFVPSYPVTNTALQIVSHCSVVTLPDRLIQIKLATQNPPQALTSGQTLSFGGYINQIIPAGVQAQVISVAPDQLYCQAVVWYDGQYTPVIQANVVAAINAYFAAIPFNGIVKVSAIEAAILSVAGVEDVQLNDIFLRPDSVPLSNAVTLVYNNTEYYNSYPLYSGYVISEQTPSFLLTESITYNIV